MGFMHTLKLLSTFLKVNIQQELAYRADAALNMALSLMWLGWELLSLSIIFSNTATLHRDVFFVCHSFSHMTGDSGFSMDFFK